MEYAAGRSDAPIRQMSTPIKLLLGALTAAPLALSGYLAWSFFGLMTRVFDSAHSIRADDFMAVFDELSVVVVAGCALTCSLMAFYLWHLLVRHADVGTERKVLWLLLIFLMPTLAMPIYWWLRLWPEGSDPGEQVATGRPRAESR